jgi:transposase-like protein
MANTIRDAGREAFWRRTLAGHEKSGLTVREFCRREKLRESAFYFWRRTIQERGPQRHVRTRRGPERRERKPPAFVPLVLGSVHAAAGIAIELRGGRVLRVNEAFPPERLAGLILALEAAEVTP